MVTKVRERFNLWKLNELEVRKQYPIKISNRFAALENNKENIKISAKAGFKQRKPWFDDEWLGFLDQRKQAKMQWLKDPNHSNVDNVNI